MRQRPLRRKAHQKKDRRTVASRRSARLARLHWNAAGIDVGAESHWVAVSDDRDTEPVRRFATCTVDLYALADWLSQCGSETVVMESTGVYGIPVFDVWEDRGFAVHVGDPHHVKQVPGRTTDVPDGQWLQELHTYGVLRGAFRPPEVVCVLRSSLRQRSLLIEEASRTMHHLQNALEHMHLTLTEVVRDSTGHTGMGIIRAIRTGERDPQVLAARRERRCKHDQATIAKAMEGPCRQEHVFALSQAVEPDDFPQHQLAACEAQIEAWLHTFASPGDLDAAPLEPSRQSHRSQGNAPAFDVRLPLYEDERGRSDPERWHRCVDGVATAQGDRPGHDALANGHAFCLLGGMVSGQQDDRRQTVSLVQQTHSQSRRGGPAPGGASVVTEPECLGGLLSPEACSSGSTRGQNSHGP